MKYFTVLFLAISLLAFPAFNLIAYEEETASLVDTEELETVCDFVDSFNTILDAMLEIIGDTEVDDMTQEQNDKLEALIFEIMNIGTIAEARFTDEQDEEAKECENYQIVDEKMETIAPYVMQVM